MIDKLKEIIKIPSVTGAVGTKEMPFGVEVNNALEYMLNLCKSFSFNTKNCNGMVGYAEIGQGEELIGILCHLDVVPAGTGWEHNPFGGEICDGKMYGRGAIDDKGPAIAVIYAMKELLQEKIYFNKRVRIIFGLQEETGDWPDMEHYKNNEELPTMGFTPDSKFPAIYCEKGILAIELSMDYGEAGIIEIEGGEAINMVADAAKCVVQDKNNHKIDFVEIGKAAHGSRPSEGENAISKLMNNLQKQNDAGKIDCKLARFYMDKIGFDINGDKIGCKLEDNESGELTLNVGKVFVKEGKVCFHIDVRHPISANRQDIINRISQSVEKYGVDTKILSFEDPVFMDKDGDIITTLINAYREITEDFSEPEVIGGGTYARAMKNIVAFGPAFPGKERPEHKNDEYIVVSDLYKIKEIYKLAIKELVR